MKTTAPFTSRNGFLQSETWFAPQELKLGIELGRNSIGSRRSLNPNVIPFVPEQFGSQHTWLNALRPTFPPAPGLTLESFNGEVIKY